jgi:subtilisin family serine protease
VSFVSFVVNQRMYLAQYTGKGIRIAVIDSGVNASHPHIVHPQGSCPGSGVSGGIAIHGDGSFDDDYVDRLGHGTAVTAAIREKAPGAEIFVIKVFWRSLATDTATLVRAIDEASGRGAGVINLSLGTAEAQHRDTLAAAVARAVDRAALIVAAVEDAGLRWWPGSLEHVVPVRIDWDSPRDAYRVVHENGRASIAASGYPRDIPGVPRERNLKGISFAVANASGFVARALEAGAEPSVASVLGTLDAAADRTAG